MGWLSLKALRQDRAPLTHGGEARILILHAPAQREHAPRPSPGTPMGHPPSQAISSPPRPLPQPTPPPLPHPPALLADSAQLSPPLPFIHQASPGTWLTTPQPDFPGDPPSWCPRHAPSIPAARPGHPPPPPSGPAAPSPVSLTGWQSEGLSARIAQSTPWRSHHGSPSLPPARASSSPSSASAPALSQGAPHPAPWAPALGPGTRRGLAGSGASAAPGGRGAERESAGGAESRGGLRTPPPVSGCAPRATRPVRGHLLAGGARKGAGGAHGCG